MIKPVLLSLGVVAVLSGCHKQDAAADPTATRAPEAAASTASPAATPAVGAGPEIAPAVSPAPPAPAVLDSQSGPEGTTWDLTKVAVVGDIMTVQFNVKPAPGRSIFVTGLKIDQVAVIDDATAQRYSVLKDETGRPLATPLQSSGETLRLSSTSEQPVVVWLKFPALPPEAKSISITIPEVGPFDGIAIQR